MKFRNDVSVADLGADAQRQVREKLSTARRNLDRRARYGTEYDFHVAVAEFFQFVLTPETIAYHTPNGEQRTKASAGRLKAMGVMPGVPDWTLLHHGKPYFIELKCVGGRISDNQKTFLSRLSQQKIGWALCYSVDNVEMALKAWGIPTTISDG